MFRTLILASLCLVPLSVLAADFQLHSSEIESGKQIADKHVLVGSGCEGGNRSPELSWSGEPAGTKSFAVTMYDSDAPTGSGWWHWSVVNIPGDVHKLDSDAGRKDGSNLPAGAAQGRTDFAGPGYGGACPPPGDLAHNYHFKVWALSVDRLTIDGEMSAAQIGYMLNVNSIASAEIVPISKR
ncbi:YbhB/YbcL family Raf kinase inhibitor-like protein [Rhizobium leguminosarum bv. viciae]|uniref:YbhB/YbcL family Raf kinase inhibitor-like protein n=1 Tax=Rhizobium leguminosarum TaxID=384 RepID=UPI001441468E|nr:YbhB/YbcL family Raf kinase inhibitor-like protein [Rhizobium leguminosarum]NKJ94698.1 YbhB/YbcL family Raf kinase inhibitor-like protein [Rhizobium leguminosarum bv. viciae]NKK87488.1 YbhB/YbcL family Raf kinase inhibitor-like protein [Rhizobium leguminosarum bv. viciae]